MRSLWIAAAVLVGTSPVVAQGDDFDRPPIQYSGATPSNVISRLQDQINAGKQKFDFEDQHGYLRSLLAALQVPTSSQTLVFSKTSLQLQRISPRKPRALYFNDDVYIGFCQQGDVLEISAADPDLGTVFYSLRQVETEKPRFQRHTDACLICHGSSLTRGVPGHLVRSVYADASGTPNLSFGTHRIDQTTPFEKRWGGWFVTGTHGKQKHLGNMVLREETAPEQVRNEQGQNLKILQNRCDTEAYLTPHSDIVALLVLEHQAEMHNHITRAMYQGRKALYEEASLNKELGRPADYRSETTQRRLRNAAEALVKYLLFAGEAPLADKVQGTSGFAQEFSARGPRDAKGRSLRQFDLEKRLFKYPCSYLIYSPSFDAIPGPVKEEIYQKLWDVLSGADSRGYEHLSAADRQAIRDILLATKQDLPEYWRRP